MRCLRICKNVRYVLHPSYNYSISLSFSAINYSLIFNSIPSNSSIILNLTSQFTPNFSISDNHNHYNFIFRLFSTSSINPSCRIQVLNSEINGIIDVIRDDGVDMESRLNSIGSNFSALVPEILIRLNLSKLPALRFYRWFKKEHPNYSSNSDICSLMVANCGLLGDYAGMLSLLKDFRNREICISDKAFSFLPIWNTGMELDTAKKLVKVVAVLLNRVGGSCCNSGIHSLIERLCSLGSFDLAKYVIMVTDGKVSRYNILVKHLCIRGQFDDARNLLENMRPVGVDPDARTYNYMISSLCKRVRILEAFAVFEEMLSKGCSANLITFEMLIYFACRNGMSDQAVVLYKQMDCSGVKPRLSTHYAFIRGYFRSHQFDEAYRYVSSIAAVDKCFAQDVYTALVRLHFNEGDLLVAHNLLIEMLDKGLKPKHAIFVRALRFLCSIGKENVAEKLKARYYTQGVG